MGLQQLLVAGGSGGPLTASVSADAVGYCEDPTSCTAVTNTVTCVASGGFPPYTYLWAWDSESTFTIGASTSASTTFSKTSSTYADFTGWYTCTVTDSLSNTAESNLVYVYTEHQVV